MLPLLLSLLMPLAEPVPTISTYAGTGQKGYSGDNGPAVKAQIDQPFDLVLDGTGNLFFSDTGNHRVRKVDVRTGAIATVAGNGKKGFGGDGGPATEAMLNEPYGLALDGDGNLLIVDRLNYCVRRVDARTGQISTIAGVGGKSGFAGDGGPATKALFVEPNGICLDAAGTIYIADVAGHRVRAIEAKTGIISTLAGNGKGLTAGDGGLLKDATFSGPRALAIGPDLCLYVVERNGNTIRKADLKKGTIIRFAGTGKKGHSGDGGPANEAAFDGPKEIKIDTSGNVYIVDTENEVIRRIDAKTGTITTVAGRGKNKNPGQGDGGPATEATLGRPHGMAIGADGAIFIGDTNSHRVRMVK